MAYTVAVAAAAAAKSLQSCLTLCGPMDCSPPGSSAHGVFQARVLEWGAIAFSDLVAMEKVMLKSDFFLTCHLFSMCFLLNLT